MKQAVMTVAVLGFSMLGLTGCAELQKQAGAFLPQQSQQQTAVEGGQPVQTLGTSQSNPGAPRNAVAQEDSSIMSDMTKEATSTLKNEVGSSIRSAIRGVFSR
ncbi:hypothetical protein [Pseudomonas sp. RL_105y_Pfl1_103]|uniref:hypothetical protein n=1 Tax=Pseudomonas sp. RL_105y_Pfl1_103 TaxID=3088707 RepID=UPI0030D9D551